MRYSKIRSLEKKYRKIDNMLFLINEALSGNKFYIEKLRNKNINIDFTYLRKMKRYIEVYTKGKSVCRVAMENYLSDVTVYRILKKFDLNFFCDIVKVSRIIEPLNNIV